MPVWWRLFDAFRPILTPGMKLAEIEVRCLQALYLANYATKECIFNFVLVKYKSLRLKLLSLKISHAHSDSESHWNNENCHFLFVFEHQIFFLTSILSDLHQFEIIWKKIVKRKTLFLVWFCNRSVFSWSDNITFSTFSWFFFISFDVFKAE